MLQIIRLFVAFVAGFALGNFFLYVAGPAEFVVNSVFHAFDTCGFKSCACFLIFQYSAFVSCVAVNALKFALVESVGKLNSFFSRCCYVELLSKVDCSGTVSGCIGNK